MKAIILWEDGKITTLQGANALKIAQHWLYKYIDCLAVFANRSVYLKER